MNKESGPLLLYGVHPTDAVAVAAAATILIAAALAAAYLPCRRAASIAPALALHHE